MSQVFRSFMFLIFSHSTRNARRWWCDDYERACRWKSFSQNNFSFFVNSCLRWANCLNGVPFKRNRREIISRFNAIIYKHIQLFKFKCILQLTRRDECWMLANESCASWIRQGLADGHAMFHRLRFHSPAFLDDRHYNRQLNNENWAVFFSFRF